MDTAPQWFIDDVLKSCSGKTHPHPETPYIFKKDKGKAPQLFYVSSAGWVHVAYYIPKPDCQTHDLVIDFLLEPRVSVLFELLLKHNAILSDHYKTLID